MQLERRIRSSRQNRALKQIEHLGEAENTQHVQVTRLGEAANCSEPILQLNKKNADDTNPQWFVLFWLLVSLDTNSHLISTYHFWDFDW